MYIQYALIFSVLTATNSAFTGDEEKDKENPTTLRRSAPLDIPVRKQQTINSYTGSISPVQLNISPFPQKMDLLSLTYAFAQLQDPEDNSPNTSTY